MGTWEERLMKEVLELGCPLPPVEQEMNQRHSRGGGRPGGDRPSTEELIEGGGKGGEQRRGSRMTVWCRDGRLLTEGRHRRPRRKVLASVCLEHLGL